MSGLISLGSSAQQAMIGSGSGGGTPPGGDPHFASVVLLMNFSNPSNRLEDATGRHTPTEQGTISWINSHPFDAGGYSFQGNTTNFIEVADSDDWHFGSDDFTVEFFYMRRGTSNNAGFMSHYEVGSTGRSWAVRQIIADFEWIWSSNGSSGNILDTLYFPPQNLWRHVAFSRNSGTLNFYVNGALDATFPHNVALFNATSPLNIGQAYGSLSSDGRMAEVRITKGVGRYPSAFTTLTESFPTF